MTGRPAAPPPIRATSPVDLELIAALNHAAAGEQWSLETLATTLASANVWGLIAARGFEAASPPAGFLLVRCAADEAEILGLVVEPPSRRRGIARALLRAAVDRLVEIGCSALFLEVAADNAAALALYDSFGLRKVGRRADYYKRPGDIHMDALIMRLSLRKQPDH